MFLFDFWKIYDFTVIVLQMLLLDQRNNFSTEEVDVFILFPNLRSW